MHFVYIVRCADGSLYTGYARDPRARVQVHNSGRGARYTAGRRPVRLVHVEAYRSLGKALRREHEIKQWTRAEKQTLISSHPKTDAGRRFSRHVSTSRKPTPGIGFRPLARPRTGTR